MEKIWLKSYDPCVPEEINPDYYASMVDFFDTCCETFQSRPAFENFNCRLSYQDLQQQSTALAAYLQQVLGVKKGDRIAIMMPNLLQYPIALFGILKAGGVVVNINPFSAAPELLYELKDSEAEILIAFRGSLKTVETVWKESAIKHVIVTEIGDLLSPCKGFLMNSVLRLLEKKRAHAISSVMAFRKALDEGKKLLSVFKKQTLCGDDLAFLQYTGGTTGVAKGAILTHRNLIANIEQASAWLKSRISSDTPQSMVITALPLYHVFSLMANLFTFVKIGAVNILVTDPRKTKALIRLLATHSFAAITGVNTLFKSLLNHPDFTTLSFAQKPIVLSGGMSLQASVAEAWQAQTGAPIIEAYGLTETSAAVCINPFSLKQFNGSVGLPVSSTEISIRDPQGVELGLNTPGELWVKGPQVMCGYWNQPEESAKVLKEGYLNTGDIATIDEAGFIRIVDRAKEMIIVSGFNVYPTEVEQVIAQMPGVLEVAVCGVAHDGLEHVAAFIVKKDLNLSEKVVIQYCEANLSAYKVPKMVQFQETLPKSTVGKILRRVLKENYRSTRV